MSSITRSRRGFTLFQLLLLLAILAILLGLLLPAVVKVRMAAMRMQGANNLRQLSLAFQNCADTHQGSMAPTIGSYPLAKDAPFNGEGTLHFHLLPYLEQQNHYNSSLDKTAKGPRYRVGYEGTAARIVKVFLAPNDPSAPPDNLYDGWLALCNYPANCLVFGQGGNRFPASITDGTSNTIFFAERFQMCNGQPHAWGYDDWYYWAPMFAYYSTERFQILPPLKDCDPERAQGLSPDGISVALGDGSVKFLTPKLSDLTWLLACQPQDGFPLGADW
jgi:type II secretory pathway pseudopilin PulG